MLYYSVIPLLEKSQKECSLIYESRVLWRKTRFWRHSHSQSAQKKHRESRMVLNSSTYDDNDLLTGLLGPY